MAKTRKSFHEQIDVLLSKFRRFKLLRDVHILKIIHVKTDLVRTNKERKKKIRNESAKFSSEGEMVWDLINIVLRIIFLNNFMWRQVCILEEAVGKYEVHSVPVALSP